MYFVSKPYLAGMYTINRKYNGQDYHIATMRWTDGSNAKVEQEVEDDAIRIVACLNHCEGIPIKDLTIGK